LLLEDVVLDDLRGAANAQVKSALRKLKRNPECGKPLGGALKGCRSIRLEDSEKRLVYRLVEVSGRSAIEVVAIDLRRADQVYKSAAGRLSN